MKPDKWLIQSSWASTWCRQRDRRCMWQIEISAEGLPVISEGLISDHQAFSSHKKSVRFLNHTCFTRASWIFRAAGINSSNSRSTFGFTGPFSSFPCWFDSGVIIDHEKSLKRELSHPTVGILCVISQGKRDARRDVSERFRLADLAPWDHKWNVNEGRDISQPTVTPSFLYWPHVSMGFFRIHGMWTCSCAFYVNEITSTSLCWIWGNAGWRAASDGDSTNAACHLHRLPPRPPVEGKILIWLLTLPYILSFHTICKREK